jgi:RimJ/RimL family protein N-acetyltransferase
MEHAPLLFPLMSNPCLTTYLAWAPHTNEDETRSVLQALVQAGEQGTGYHWIILEAGEARGLISLIDVRRRHRLLTLERAEIAYWVAVEHQGRGIATEATAAVVDAAFSHLKFNRLLILHTTTNTASARIPQKLGFRFMGRERQAFCKDGIWHDQNHFEILAEDWRRTKQMAD